MIFTYDNRIQVPYGTYGYARSTGPHKGQDIDTVSSDRNVHSTVDGTVKWARVVARGASGWGNTWEWGYFVWIVDRNRVDHIFAHMKAGSLKVVENQVVKKGDILGVMGKTGNAQYDAQAEHVHYEVRINGKAVNPTSWSKVPNVVGTVWNKTNNEGDDNMLPMSTQPVKMWFGPMSIGDKNKFIAELDRLMITFTEENTKLTTAVAVSKGDQMPLMKLANEIGNIAYGPAVSAAAGVEQAVYDAEVTKRKEAEATISTLSEKIVNAYNSANKVVEYLR